MTNSADILQTLTRKYSNVIDSQIFDYFIEAFTDLDITASNIQQQAMLISTYRAKWVAIQFAERMKLDKLEKLAVTYVTNKTNQYLKEHPEERHMPRQVIQDDIIREDADYAKIAAGIDLQKKINDFVTPIVQIFVNHGFSVKTALDSLKLTLLA